MPVMKYWNGTEWVEVGGGTSIPVQAGAPSSPSDGDLWLDTDETDIFGLSEWTAYTPTLTNITLGDGTIEGWYYDTGKLRHVWVEFVVGSTTAFTVSVTASLGLPTGTYDTTFPMEGVIRRIASGGSHTRGVARVDSTGISQIILADGGGPWNYTTPASGDTVTFAMTAMLA